MADDKHPTPPTPSPELLAANARLWLLLRWLDTGGQGWLSRTDMRTALTDPDSPTRFCTDRYLRQLLARGDRLFWQQDEAGKRVWLRSLARVAAALGVRRLRGRLVAVPVPVLLGGIGAFRAHLYATLHSSRGDEAVPVSRARLQELSGASPRTQQSYETRAGVTAVPCVALGAVVGTADAQETAWRYGRAGFIFTDHNGRHGAAGRQYHARRLPNRYRGPHPAGRRPRRLNRKLTDLCHHGDAGNGRGTNRQRGYLLAADGRLAARMWLRADGLVTVYWPQAGGQQRKGMWVWYERPSLLV